MAFFREGMTVGEEEMLEIERIQSEDDPYLASALSSVYDDTNNLVSGAEVVPERMRMSLLATSAGHPVIAIVSDGVQYAYDYDKDGSYAKDHYAKLSDTSMWSDTANSKPLTDLNNARKKLQKQGKIARYALMNSNTFQYLLDNLRKGKLGTTEDKRKESTMDSLKDFYDFYRPLQRKYDLQMIYKTNSKEAKITIRWHGKEIVKVTEETTEACFSRTKRELEERMKKYEQQTETKEKAQRAGFYMDKIRESYAEKQQ